MANSSSKRENANRELVKLNNAILALNRANVAYRNDAAKMIAFIEAVEAHTATVRFWMAQAIEQTGSRPRQEAQPVGKCPARLYQTSGELGLAAHALREGDTVESRDGREWSLVGIHPDRNRVMLADPDDSDKGRGNAEYFPGFINAEFR